VTEEQLAEAERRLKNGCPDHWGYNGETEERTTCYCFDDFEDTGLAMIAEIRRLREQMRLGNTDPNVTLRVNTQPGHTFMVYKQDD
jgi:hypothetical protein